VPFFLASANYGKKLGAMISPSLPTVVLLFVLIAATLLASIAIASASFRWVRSQVFGYGGAALVIVGVILLSLVIRGALEFQNITLRSSALDTAALQRIIDDAHSKTLAAIRESNKHFAERIEANQEQTLSAIQSHVLAIRTALMQRQAAPPEARSEQTSSGTSKALRSRSPRRSGGGKKVTSSG